MPSDNKDGCGIAWLWFDEYDKYRNACLVHDHNYVSNEQPEPTVADRKEVDQAFLRVMLTQSQGKPLSVAKAYLYYTIVRSVGWLWW